MGLAVVLLVSRGRLLEGLMDGKRYGGGKVSEELVSRSDVDLIRGRTSP